jgi:hypothetical protein
MYSYPHAKALLKDIPPDIIELAPRFAISLGASLVAQASEAICETLRKRQGIILATETLRTADYHPPAGSSSISGATDPVRRQLPVLVRKPGDWRVRCHASTAYATMPQTSLHMQRSLPNHVSPP